MEEKKIDRRIFLIFILLALAAIGTFAYKQFAGLIIILALIVFGSLAVLWKDQKMKIAGLLALVALALINIGLNGIKFGIDFNGGVRIPIILEKSVDQETMNIIVDTVKKRVSFLGLTEARVRAIGDNAINVELAKASDKNIDEIEGILSEQGVFFGIVDGKIVIKGEDIYRESIGSTQPPQGRDWAVAFSLTAKGGGDFARLVKGKANFPLYMFIDRPEDAAIFISLKDLRKDAPGDAIDSELIKTATDTLRLDEGNIELYIIEKLDEFAPKTNKTIAIISKSEDAAIKDKIKEKGFVIRETEDISPKIQGGSSGLSIDVFGDQQTSSKLALEEVRRLETILKGGALPVQISLGSKTEIPATLGNEALKISLIGITAALVAISILIALRYSSPKVILPIIAISISELIILLSILGSFTVDLAAIAGIIAAIGVGVDAQIVITDEMLKKAGSLHERIEHAFDIIKTNVVVAVVAMLPLLFSGIVEVINFSISTILGSLLGFLISRPAYAILAEKILGEK
ncbi:hypothetical protein J4450_01530 [Candidatus Micrarchaeota archaeon]|nr:hypothetical protein [Candidatus Micrarchaeota archaeon]